MMKLAATPGFTNKVTLLAIALFVTTTINVLAQSTSVKEIKENRADAENAAPKGIVKGKVTTSDNKPAEGVSIVVKGTTKGTLTDENGFYEIRNLVAGSYTLLISYAGLETKESQVQIQAGQAASADISLKETANALDEVVIEGKRSQNLQTVNVGKIPVSPFDLPQSVAIVGQGTIRDQQAQRLSDIIKNVNGVYLSTTRGSVQESFSARGYAFSSTNMFKNGSRVNSGVMPEVSSLERVEVLKGSAAILYGNVAPGGILNMVTKQPKFNWGGEVSMRAGSYNLYKPAFDVYGPLSSKIAFRINGTYEDAKSYRDVVKSKRYYINPSLLVKLSNKTELLIQGDYLNHNFTPDFGIGSLDNTKIPDVKRSAFFGTPWQYNKAQQTTATASLKHKISNNWNINFTTSFQQYKRDYYSTERIQADSTGKWVRPLNKILSDEKYFIGQLDITGKFSTGSIEHTLLTGIDADRYYTTSYTFNNPTTYDTINILDPSKYTARTDIPAASKLTRAQTPINRFGAYVQDLISITPKIKFLAGVRWSIQDAPAVTTTYYKNDSTAKGTTKTDKAFSPRFGLVYKLRPATSAFISYANSFTVNSGTDIYYKALDPSIIDQYEIGIKNDFFKGLLSVNVTAYRIINHNLAQTAQFDANGNVNNNTNLKELVGETTSDGVEVDFSAHPVKGIDLIAGYSYNNMRYTKTPDAKGNYVEGERLVNTPAHTANGSAFYTFTQGKLRGFKIGATVVYIGDRFGGWNNQKQQTQNYSRLIPVSGFTTVDISAGYTYKKVSLLAKVSNLTNTFNYYVHENYSINPIPPTQFITTLSYKF